MRLAKAVTRSRHAMTKFRWGLSPEVCVPPTLIDGGYMVIIWGRYKDAAVRL